MSEGKRPGGLTALAVINFIFAAMGLLGILGLATFLAFSQMEDGGNPDMQKMKEEFAKSGLTVTIVVLLLAISVLTTLLEILSGIGYLLQKKFLGRLLGNMYAVVAIGTSLAMAIWGPQTQGGGFTVGTIFGLVYPVLTLLLLNTTFKEDFIN
ncbi:MAG: hypothetical protein JW829_00350 [Pirellulales bacterium]|nr:hypothetical protein [Pirellulales bacterium]